MVIKNLLNKARKLSLAGLTSVLLFAPIDLAPTNIVPPTPAPVQAQEIAPQNQNFVQFGARNSTSKWSYGPMVDSSGFYVQVGRGLTDRFTAFVEGYVENPVINEGFSLHSNPDNTFDVSPNTYIAGFAIGARGKFFETEDKKWSVCGEVRLSRLSEFDDLVNWSSNKRSEIRIHGITHIDSALWVNRKAGNLNLRAGAALGSSYAMGDVLTHTVNSPTEVTTVYSEFNQRNKLGIYGKAGVGYSFGNNLKFNADAQIGKDSTSIDISISKSW